MCPPVKKSPVLLFFMILIVSLCNIPVVFATDDSPVAASTTSLENETPDTAATADELLDWLDAHQRTGGTVRLTADIFLGSLSMSSNLTAPITVDTGEFSIIATGCVELYWTGLTISGDGGEKGVLRAAKGGHLSIGHLTVIADEGYTVVQEEGAGFGMDNVSLTSDSVWYADTPFVCYWDPVLALVESGQKASDVLPVSVRANVSRHNVSSDEEIPVIWELSGHETNEEQRLRFTAKGTVSGFGFAEELTCTVVYNDYPFTFTEVTAEESRNTYLIAASFTKPEVTFPITVSQEYSFDGETWAEMDERQVWNWTTLDFLFSQNEVDGEVLWDTDINPWLYIRIHWNNGEVTHYSNVLRFSGVDFGAATDIGGNRGGGTDITDPPTLEKPVPPSPPDSTQQPPSAEKPVPPSPPDSTQQPPSAEKPVPPSPPDSTQQLPAMIIKAPKPYIPSVVVEFPAAGQPELPDKSVANAPAAAQSETPRQTNPALLNETPEISAAPAVMPPAVLPPAALPQSHRAANSPFSKALPIVVGCTVTAILIGAAGIYHSEALRKRLSGVLKKIKKN